VRQKQQQQVPGILWVALIVLAIAALGKLASLPRYGPLVFVDIAICVALMIGIYYGHRWAFVLTVVVVPAKLLFSMMTGSLRAAVVVFLIDCLVMVPVLMSKNYFWGRRCLNVLCGHRNNQQARFCARCGADLTTRENVNRA
jgi:hypothetical protein